jgi:hypothetical protein
MQKYEHYRQAKVAAREEMKFEQKMAKRHTLVILFPLAFKLFPGPRSCPPHRDLSLGMIFPNPQNSIQVSFLSSITSFRKLPENPWL